MVAKYAYDEWNKTMLLNEVSYRCVDISPAACLQASSASVERLRRALLKKCKHGKYRVRKIVSDGDLLMRVFVG